MHLDLALERQEKLCRELSKKMENKKLFDETEFALLYLQVRKTEVLPSELIHGRTTFTPARRATAPSPSW